MHQFDECEACLKAVLELEPGNITARREHIRLRGAIKEYKNQSAAMARRALAGPGSEHEEAVSSTPSSKTNKVLNPESIAASSLIDLTPALSAPALSSPREGDYTATGSPMSEPLSFARPRKSIGSRHGSFSRARGSSSGSTGNRRASGDLSSSVPPTTGEDDPAVEQVASAYKEGSIRRGWPFFLMTLVSLLVVLITIAFGYHLSQQQQGQGQGQQEP